MQVSGAAITIHSLDKLEKAFQSLNLSTYGTLKQYSMFFIVSNINEGVGHLSMCTMFLIVSIK
jgi:hypothetical protein